MVHCHSFSRSVVTFRVWLSKLSKLSKYKSCVESFDFQESLESLAYCCIFPLCSLINASIQTSRQSLSQVAIFSALKAIWKNGLHKWKKKKSGIIIWSLVFRIYRLWWMKAKRGFSAGSGLCVMSLSAFSLRSSKDAYFWSFSGMHPGKCNRTSKQNRLILNLLLFVTTICPLVGRISPRPYSHQKHFLRSFFTRPLVLGR